MTIGSSKPGMQLKKDALTLDSSHYKYKDQSNSKKQEDLPDKTREQMELDAWDETAIAADSEVPEGWGGRAPAWR